VKYVVDGDSVVINRIDSNIWALPYDQFPRAFNLSQSARIRKLHELRNPFAGALM